MAFLFFSGDRRWTPLGLFPGAFHDLVDPLPENGHLRSFSATMNDGKQNVSLGSLLFKHPTAAAIAGLARATALGWLAVVNSFLGGLAAATSNGLQSMSATNESERKGLVLAAQSRGAEGDWLDLVDRGAEAQEGDVGAWAKEGLGHAPLDAVAKE